MFIICIRHNKEIVFLADPVTDSDGIPALPGIVATSVVVIPVAILVAVAVGGKKRMCPQHHKKTEDCEEAIPMTGYKFFHVINIVL